jgi:hypothetical protein
MNTTKLNKVVMIGQDSIAAEYLQAYPTQPPNLAY